VTPTAYQYPPGDVRRYGADPTGVADSTTAIQNAYNVAAKGFGAVYFPAGANTQSVYSTGPINVYEGTHTIADAGVLVQMNTDTIYTNIFTCASTFQSANTLASNGTLGATTVSASTNTGLVAGALVEIYDATYKYGSSGQNLELNEVASISGSGPYTVTLRNPLIGTYATASSAAIKAASVAARKIRFESVMMKIPSGKDGGGILFQDAYQCDAINCRVIGPNSQPGITFWRSAYCSAINLFVQDGQAQSTPGYGYGVNMGSSAHHCTVYASKFTNVRENAVADNVRFSGFDGCIAEGCYDNGFNAHALGASDCFFINCRAIGSVSKGFYTGGSSGNTVYDQRITFKNCEAINCGYFGFWVDGASSYNTQDITLDNCKAFNCCLTNASSYQLYAFNSTRLRVKNCHFDANGVSNSRGVVKIENCTDAVLRGNTARGATSGWGIMHANCTGILVDGNEIGNIGSNQGVRAEGTASTSVFVVKNKVDNDIIFSYNAGDYHRGNLYNTKFDEASGVTGAIATGTTVTHGLVTTPTTVILTAQDGTPTAVYPSSIGGTTFAITYTGGGTHAFAWQAYT